MKKGFIKNIKKNIVLATLLVTTLITSIPQPIAYAQTATTSSDLETLPDPTTLEITVPSPTPIPTTTDIESLLPEALPGANESIDPTLRSASIRRKPTFRKIAKDSYGTNEKVTVKVDNAKDEPITVRVTNSQGDKTEIDYTVTEEGDSKNFTLVPPSNLTPGKYTLTLTDAFGGTSTQDFYWGVLAINMDKSIYLQNEKVNFQMAVLDDMGRMVCDADVTLVITSPDSKRTVLKTEDGLIKVNPECFSKDVTIVPDYEATVNAPLLGRYDVELSAITRNGEWKITDFFEVRESVDFDIKRSAPTRIYPLQPYPVNISIKANKDFKGVITEIVPDEFDITQFSDPGYIPYTKVTNSSEEAITNDNILGAFVSLGLPFLGNMELTQEFGGLHPDPLIQAKYEAYGVVGHDGIDFAMPTGTSIVSVDSGTVAYASENGDYGTTIVIQHKWGKTYYGHLSEIKVETGDRVQRGDIIALSGNTGLSTGPHLHFGMKLDVNNTTNGYYGKTDPLPFLGLAPRPTVLGMTTVAEPQVKTIAWQVDVKAGDTINIGYNFDAPDISPQFYTTGPLRFRDEKTNLLFKEGRRWQIASDDIVTETFNADTTWVAPVGVTSVTVEVWGAGGGGGGQYQTTADGGGGGGGGSYSRTANIGVNPGSSYTVEIGTGGPGGGNAGAASCGTAGGDSWFISSSTVMAKGGSPGCHSTGTPPAGGAGGVGTNGVGTTRNSGGAGGAGRNNNSGSGGGGGEAGCSTGTGNNGTSPGGTTGGAGGTGCDGGDGGTGGDVNTSGSSNGGAGGGGGGSGDFASGGNKVGGDGEDGQVKLTYGYVAPPPEFTLEGYTFENDDEDQATGDANDSNTVLAGSEFSSGKTLTSVRKGERLTVRMHLTNTASASAGQGMGLFYDRNDGIWAKAEASTSATLTAAQGNCTDTDWNCEAVISANELGEYTSMAIDPSGIPWVTYYENFTTSCNDSPTSECSLGVAMYVGSGGTGCASNAWQCTIIDNPTTTSNVGQYTSISFSRSGVPWISYYDVTNTALKVATYVGTGGTGCTGTTQWSCESVDTTGTATGEYSSIVVDRDGYPWVSYYDVNNTALKVATRGGGFGSACSDADWTCAVVDQDTDTTGLHTSIAIDPTNKPWVAYYDQTLAALSVAQYVGAGGSGCGATGSTLWSCETVDDSVTNTGRHNSIAFDPSGNPWVSSWDSGNTALRVSTKGGGFGSACTDSDWTCGAVDNDSDNTGEYTSLAFGPGGTAWVSYYDTSTDQLMVARYVGSGGSGCGASGSSSWTCTAVDNTGTDTGSYTSIAFNPKGNAVVSYYDTTNSALRVARIHRGGEIFATPGLSGTNGDSIQASHADMTSATDSSGKSDADCLAATTWNNGKWFESSEGTGWSIANGASTTQCTEVAFTIDTSKTIPGTTYRLIVATDDYVQADMGKWRGPIAVATDGYPTLTIEANTVRRYSKDSNAIFANCTDTTWGCVTVDATSTLGTFWNALTIDSTGTPWINYYNDHASADELKVAKYVGSGGNCDDTGGSDAWQCTVVDASAAIIGANGSITSDKKGNIWVSYRDSTNGDMKVAVNYDHPDMSACTAAGWDCELVDGTSASMGNETTISIDPNGNPWVSYRDSTNTDLRYARFVGTGGNCTSTEWECGDIDDVGGEDTTIIFDDNGKAYVSYFSPGGVDLKVAEYVGAGGTCSGGPKWNCVVVDSSSANLGNYTSMAIDKKGYPWVVYHDTSGAALRVATKQNDPNMSACSASGWDCGIIDNTVTAGADPSIQFDEKNMALVGYYTSTTIKTARYVGTGGSCSGSGNIWNCTTLDSSAADVGEYSHNGLKFDHSGVPWVVYQDVTNANIKVAKLHMPDYVSDFRYVLDSGKAPATAADGTCDSTTDNKGYCGAYAQDSNYDQITTLANERPMYMFAERFATNSTAPTATWQGRTNIAPTTDTLTLQVYRFGSTNAWENLDTDSASSDCSSADCELTGTASGTASEYYQADGSNYWVYYRVFQTENASAITLKTGCFDGGNGDCTGGGGPETPTLDKLMRGGKWFNSSGVRQPFTF